MLWTRLELKRWTTQGQKGHARTGWTPELKQGGAFVMTLFHVH